MKNRIIFEHGSTISSPKRKVLAEILGSLKVDIVNSNNEFPDVLVRDSPERLRQKRKSLLHYLLYPVSSKQSSYKPHNPDEFLRFEEDKIRITGDIIDYFPIRNKYMRFYCFKLM